MSGVIIQKENVNERKLTITENKSTTHPPKGVEGKTFSIFLEYEWKKKSYKTVMTYEIHI